MHLYKYSAEDTSIVYHVMKSYFQRLIHAKYHIYVFLWLRTGNISLHLSVLLVVFESGYSHRKWNWFCDDSKWENQKDFLMSKKKTKARYLSLANPARSKTEIMQNFRKDENSIIYSCWSDKLFEWLWLNLSLRTLKLKIEHQSWTHHTPI